MKIINKTCTKCHAEHPAESKYFGHNKNCKDGFFQWCKRCKSGIDKKYHKDNIDYIKKQCKEWRQNNKESKRIADKNYNNKMIRRADSDIIVPSHKVCSKCGQNKSFKDFYKDKSVVDGLTGYCKSCCNIYNRGSYQKHKEKRRVSGLAYREENKGSIAKQKTSYSQNNKEKIQQYKREWQLKNSKKISICQKRYRLEHKLDRREYEHNRKVTDFNYRLLNNLRGRLYYALIAQKSKKSNKTMGLIGCSIDELKVYIQSLFSQGMTFDNYGKGNGKWSIDHIRPCSSFDLSDFEQQKECFHYFNLRPLWNIDNHSKNSLYNGKYIRKNRKVI